MAAATYKRAIELDPQDALYHNNLGNVYQNLRQYDQAIEEHRKAVDLGAQDTDTLYSLASDYYLLHEYYAAIQPFQQSLSLAPSRYDIHISLANIYKITGKKDEAERELNVIRQEYSDITASFSVYELACFYAVSEDVEQAVAYLVKALRDGETTMEWVKEDPDLDPIRTDSRFQKLIDTLYQ